MLLHTAQFTQLWWGDGAGGEEGARQRDRHALGRRLGSGRVSKVTRLRAYLLANGPGSVVGLGVAELAQGTACCRSRMLSPTLDMDETSWNGTSKIMGGGG